MQNRQIIFILAGVLMLTLAVFAAQELVNITNRGQEIKDLQRDMMSYEEQEQEQTTR